MVQQFMFRLALTLLLASHAVNPAIGQNTSAQKKTGQSPSATATQQPQSNPSNPLLQPIPFDHRITRDSLANGLKYFIKPNAKPEKKIELRLVVNAGSILENDNQQGMAHFIEHMNFNGTQNYPKNALVDYLQTIGVQFGADLNAYTSFDETVYILPIPTNNPDHIEKGFQVHDWPLCEGIEGNKVLSSDGCRFRTQARRRSAAALPRSEGVASHLCQHFSKMKQMKPPSSNIQAPEKLQFPSSNAARRDGLGV